MSPSTTFVGRQQLLTALAHTLPAGGIHVLIGPPGVGKTRLAREVAYHIGDQFRHGTVFVDLAASTDPSRVPAVIAKALAILDYHRSPTVELLVAHLRETELLLILDNCEHVLDACTQVADALTTCRRVTVLATSQVALGVPGERAWPVTPLSLPAEAAPADELDASEAVALFTACASLTNPAFASAPGGVTAVGEICRRLDGLPLAIELAAARIAVLAPVEIAERLDRRFNLLTRGSPTAPLRHQTLKTALDWSYELLSEAGQILLRRLSVFSGGWNLEAVLSVCANGDQSDAEVGRTLVELVDRSLITADPGTDRYTMLESIRLYGEERLGAGEAPALRSRHARWCLAVAERAEPEITGRHQDLWLRRLELDYDNLRAGLTWAIAEREVPIALRLAGSLGIFWRIRGYWSEARDFLFAVLALEGGETLSRAKARWAAGLVLMMLDDHTAAAAVLGEAIATARDLGARGLEGRCLLVMAHSAARNGDLDKALDLYSQSTELARVVGDTWCLGHSLALWGRAHQMVGNIEAAGPLIQESLALARQATDQQSLRFGLTAAGLQALIQGELDEADQLLEEGLVAAQSLGEPFVVAFTMRIQGVLAMHRGDYQRSGRLLETAHAVSCEGGVPQHICESLSCQGDLAYAEGNLGTARERFTQAASTATNAGFIYNPALRGLAEVALAEGSLSTGQAWLDQISSHGPVDGLLRAEITLLRSCLSRRRGDAEEAVNCGFDAVQFLLENARNPALTGYAEVLAGALIEVGLGESGVQLLAAADARRGACGFVRPPIDQLAYEADLAAGRRLCGAAGFRAAWADGAAGTIPEALAKARLGVAERPRSDVGGWTSLSRAERRVVALVAELRTNSEIGRRLGISPKTVEIHLTHVFAKLKLRTRRELAAAVASRGADEFKAEREELPMPVQVRRRAT